MRSLNLTFTVETKKSLPDFCTAINPVYENFQDFKIHVFNIGLLAKWLQKNKLFLLLPQECYCGSDYIKVCDWIKTNYPKIRIITEAGTDYQL